MTAGGATDGKDTRQEGVGYLARSAPPSIDGTRRRDRGGRQSPERRYNGHLVIEDHGQRLTGPLGERAECSPLPQRVNVGRTLLWPAPCATIDGRTGRACAVYGKLKQAHAHI